MLNVELKLIQALYTYQFLATRSQPAVPGGQEWEDRNRALRAERDRLSASHRGLKATLERQRAQQAERLRQISIDRCAPAMPDQDALSQSYCKHASDCFLFTSD